MDIKKVIFTLFLLYLFLSVSPIIGSALATGQEEIKSSFKSDVLEKAKRLLVPFIANEGQMDKEVAFYARTFGGAVFVTKGGSIVYSLPKSVKEDERSQGWVLREELVGGSINKVKGEEQSLTNVSAFTGKDPTAWKSNIPTYGFVNLGEVYEGIELKLKAYGNNVEKLFYVHPGGKPEQIRVMMQGLKSLIVSGVGELVAGTDFGTGRFSRPIAYQEIDGRRIEVPVNYDVIDMKGVTNRDEYIYGFTVGSYDQKRVLVIDPLLQSTYLGGSGGAGAQPIAIDTTGNVYVTGSTQSIAFPGIAGGAQTANHGGLEDVFITKLNASLTSIIQSTYLGGGGMDRVRSIAFDTNGNVYVTGETDSADFPGTNGGAQATFGGGYGDAFVTKLDASLTSIIQSTYLGGSNEDDARSIAIDLSGNVYIAGITDSNNFPGTSGGAKASYGGHRTAFVTKLNSDLTSINQSTYLGGNDSSRYAIEFAESITLDANGNVYVSGITQSNDFPGTAGGAQVTFGGNSDVFVAKLNASLTSILQSTYLGGSDHYGYQQIGTMTIDASGNVYVAGLTTSTNFPGTAGGAQTSYRGEQGDVFVTKFNASLTSIIQSTYLGGRSRESPTSIAIGVSGNVYVAGYTRSYDFPGTAGGAQASHGGDMDVFVTKFNASLTSIIQSTYLGGSGYDMAGSIAIDTIGNIYIAGSTDSTNFPGTAGGAQASYQGQGSADAGQGTAFVAKFDATLLAEANLTVQWTGNGIGTVISTPAGISCGSGCSKSFLKGSIVSLSATAEEGSSFTGWSGDCSETSTTCIVTMDAAKTVMAMFTLDTNAITTTAGAGGVISPSTPTLNYDSSQTFTITPDAHYHVVDVKVDGVSVGAVTTYSLTNVTVTHTISATFAINTYAIISSAGANGSITPSVTVNHGGNSIFTITPNANYHVTDVLVDGTSVGSVISYNFTNVTAPHTISATFAVDTCDLTVTRSGVCGGAVTSIPIGINCGTDCTDTYALGTQIILTATPNTGCTFAGWFAVCSGSGPCTVKMDTGKRVGASFNILGDVNGDAVITLADAILAWRVVAGMDNQYTHDVNGDGKLGLPEAIYILQKVAGMR